MSLAGLLLGWLKGCRRYLVWNVFSIIYFVVMSSYIVHFPRNLMPLLPLLALNAAVGVTLASTGLSRPLRSVGLRPHWSHPAFACVVIAVAAWPLWASVRDGILRTREDTITLTGEWFNEHVPDGVSVCFGYERLAPRYVPPIYRPHLNVLPIEYENLRSLGDKVDALCDLFVINEQVFSPRNNWRLRIRFDPETLGHPGRRIGVYDIPKERGPLTREYLEDFEASTSADYLRWRFGRDKAQVKLSGGQLHVQIDNTAGVRDLVAFELRLPANLTNAVALLVRILLERGSFLTLESIVDGSYSRPLDLNYLKGNGEWQTLVMVLPRGKRLDGISVSLSEPDETARTPRYAVSLDWVQLARAQAETHDAKGVSKAEP